MRRTARAPLQLVEDCEFYFCFIICNSLFVNNLCSSYKLSFTFLCSAAFADFSALFNFFTKFFLAYFIALFSCLCCIFGILSVCQDVSDHAPSFLACLISFIQLPLLYFGVLSVLSGFIRPCTEFLTCFLFVQLPLLSFGSLFLASYRCSKHKTCFYVMIAMCDGECLLRLASEIENLSVINYSIEYFLQLY